MNQKKSVKLNAVLNVVKELMSIIFPMITFPYATRILGLDNYGEYTFSSSIVNYISYIASAGILRYAIRECAKVRDNKKKLSTLINEIFTINIITTIIAYIILAALLLFWKRLDSYTPIILMISLSVLFTTIGTDWINAAYEDYLFITVRYIISQAIAVVMMFLLVRSKSDVIWYAFVTVLGSLLANGANFIHIRARFHLHPRFVLNGAVKKHIRPVLYFFASTVASFIYINSDVTMLGIFKTDIVVGLYGVSTKFYSMIKQLINAAFVVVIPRVSRGMENDREKASEKLSEILGITLLISIPMACGLFMVRNSLILVFAGREYAQAESSLAILAISLVPAILANFFINIILIPIGDERDVTIATVTSAAVNILLNIILIPAYAENGAAFTTLLAELIMTFMGMFYSRKIHIRVMSKDAVISIISGIIIIGVCYIVNQYIENPIFNLFMCVIVSVISYGSIVFVFYKDKALKVLKR